MAAETNPEATQGLHNPPALEEIEGEGWIIDGGKISREGAPGGFRSDGIEPLTYNNPFAQDLERVWFDGKIVFALDGGELEIEEAGDIKVAREYQCVYSVELDERGKLQSKEEVPGQFNIYDSVPGMDGYSPIWRFYYVVVPRDYRANAFRSIEDCDRSGYRIVKSSVFEN